MAMPSPIAISSLDMSLSNGATWTGAALNVTNVNVRSGRTWTMDANSDGRRSR